jgi:hypothetical protein
MRDGNSFGEQLLPLSVPLVAAVGAESPMKPSPPLLPWLAVLTRERHGLGEFRVLLRLNVVALVLIRGDDRAPGQLLFPIASDMVGA